MQNKFFNMKNILFSICCFIVSNAHAQVHLSGSVYAQNFDALSSGLPLGWGVDTNAKTASPGGSALAGFIAVPGTGTRWGNTSGGFKNVASANGFANFAAGTSALQLAATDRALGVKQTGTFGDAGASFTFKIDHTFRLSDFEMDFKLQSLDSSNGSKLTTWLVQYAVGAIPGAFTTVSTGMMTTGGNTFSNTLYNIAFGSAINDKRDMVWIRIVTLSTATGTGSRATTAIDDVELRWTGIADPGFRPIVQKFFPANGAINVPLGTVLTIDFSKYVSLGAGGSVYIKNETDNKTQTINAASTFLKVTDKQLLISGVKLDTGKVYHVTFDSTIVDTVLAATYSVEDTTEWRFSTIHSLPHYMNYVETFDTSCVLDAMLPKGWIAYSEIGNEKWDCGDLYGPRIYGNNSGVNTENVDWLISPIFNISGASRVVSFYLHKSHSGNELQILLSHNYAGSGSPDSAIWTPVPMPFFPADTNVYKYFSIPVIGFQDSPTYFAFRYTSNSGGAYDLEINDFAVYRSMGINEITKTENGLKVIGNSSSNNIALQISNTPEGYYQLELFNAVGQRVYQKEIILTSGNQNFDITDVYLSSGMYIVKLSNTNLQFLQKCIVR